MPPPNLAKDWSFLRASGVNSRHCTSSSETPPKLGRGRDVGLSSSQPTHLFPPLPPMARFSLGVVCDSGFHGNKCHLPLLTSPFAVGLHAPSLAHIT